MTLGLSPMGAVARAATLQRTIRCFQSLGTPAVSGAPAHGARFITFDPPGSTFTVPSGITPNGVITGYYTDSSGVTHGFLRARDGSFTTFDPPGSALTQPASINPAGEIAGTY